MPNGGAYQEQLRVAADDLARLVRRLRGLSTRGWATREEAVRAALREFVRISATVEGRRVPGVPEVAEHVLADAIAVVAGDALDALAIRINPVLLADAADAIRRAWEQTR